MAAGTTARYRDPDIQSWGENAMAFSGIDYIAVLAAAAAGFAFGALWYGALARQWMAAAKLSEADLQMEGFAHAVPYLVAAVSQLVLATLLAGLMSHLDRVDLAGGLTTAFWLWLGFVATTMAVNHRFQAKGWDLTAIDGGHWLLSMLIQGAIIGLFGV